MNITELLEWAKNKVAERPELKEYYGEEPCYVLSTLLYARYYPKEAWQFYTEFDEDEGFEYEEAVAELLNIKALLFLGDYKCGEIKLSKKKAHKLVNILIAHWHCIRICKNYWYDDILHHLILGCLQVAVTSEDRQYADKLLHELYPEVYE